MGGYMDEMKSISVLAGFNKMPEVQELAKRFISEGGLELPSEIRGEILALLREDLKASSGYYEKVIGQGDRGVKKWRSVTSKATPRGKFTLINLG